MKRIAQCLLLAPALLGAQKSDTLAARQLAPGVAYRQFTDARGPWSVHLVRVDLRRADVELRHVRALDSLRGRERPSDMARRVGASGVDVLAAVNADFFDLRTGENENEQVIAGEWWKGLKVTDSPYDTFDNVHAQLAVTTAPNGSHRAVVDRYLLDATYTARGATTPILTVNAPPDATFEGTALYTPRYGAATPRDTARRDRGPRDVDAAADTTRRVAEAPLASAGRRGDTLLYVRRGAVSTSAGTAIPRDGAVLSAFGPRAAAVRALGDGDTVKVRLATRPRLPNGAAPSLVIGGWPRILENGANVAGDAATVEGTISRNAEVRHPRTAVGVSRDGNTLYLLVVDGRSPKSVGMTLVELAGLMKSLGAWNALNFDGGGSSAMVLGDAVVNVPSDPGGERAVGNALFVVRRRAPFSGVK